MKQTGLYENHRALGAKMVDFAGWQMPVQYEGVIQEHQAVRKKAGIFDVSHMGRVCVTGPDAEKLMDYLSTNRISGKKDFSATYTVWCRESGGAVDDLIVYKEGPERFFVIVNASNREKDLEHLKQVAAGHDVAVEDKYEDGILAVQGPKAKQIAAKIFPEAEELKPMRFVIVSYNGNDVVLSGTGYTGEKGLEIFAPAPVIVDLWNRLLKEGVPEGIQPIGLAARDTLRLEAGFALYGHELSEEIAPTESVSAWTVKWDRDFLGKSALEELEKNSRKRHEYGVVLTDRGVAREGYDVFQGEERVGAVTSGTMSPTLGQAIAIILVERKLQEGDNVEIQVRNKKCKAKVVNLPFYKK